MFFQLFFISIIAIIGFFSPINLITNIILTISSIIILLLLDYIIKKIPFHKIMTTILSLAILSAFIFFLSNSFGLTPQMKENIIEVFYYITVNLIVILLFFSIQLGASSDYFKKENHEDESHLGEAMYIMDTSAIIDGRVIDVCEAGFLSPHLIVPEFVIKELQLISDSSNHEKRKKGRRGLDLLRKMKKSEKLSVQISNLDYKETRGVDNKLLVLAKDKKANIVTTDFNLTKVADLEGIKVININKIATILKPYYNTGDKLKVNIIKKGNNHNQGISYLDDDTMVVIEDGEQHIGKLKQVIVTSYVQSESGKMVFCKMINSF